MPRPGRFDSELVEPGPPARVDGEHVTLIYNAKGADGTYAPGQVNRAGSPGLARE